MNATYMTNNESRPCACGGRTCHTPSILANHQKTKKHRSWQFNTLSAKMLEDLTPPAKRSLLLELRPLAQALV